MAGAVYRLTTVLLCFLWVTRNRGMWYNRSAELQQVLRAEEAKIKDTTIENLIEDGLHNALLEQIQTGSSGNAEMSNDADLITTELDMTLTSEQYHALYVSTEFSGRRSKRKATKKATKLWPNATIPYTLDGRAFAFHGLTDAKVLRMAMSEWEHFTCFKFKHYDKDVDEYYVNIRGSRRGCSSALGMIKRKPQYINLKNPECLVYGIFLHELGHAIGLYHEHQRPDRDDYVRVKKENIRTGFETQLKKFSHSDVDTDVPYDFRSIMHYGKTAFGKKEGSKRLQTIFAYNSRNEDYMGKGTTLSFSDVKTVNLLYSCNSHCKNVPHCKDGGFVDKTCQCLCPDGSRNCQIGGSVNDPNKNCRNKHPHDDECEQWAKERMCSLNPLFTIPKCMKSCNKCGINYKGDSGRAKGYCKNPLGDEECKYLAFAWYCDANPAYMIVNCPQACGWCHKKSTVECEDLWMNRDECAVWASMGYCRFQKPWMLANCRKSCDWCQGSWACSNRHRIDQECAAWASVGECSLNAKYMYEKCRHACGKCGVVKYFGCHTFYEEEDCRERARTGECFGSKNSDTVWACRQHCHRVLCMFGDCEDTDDSCEQWAKQGECHFRPQFMMSKCKKSCKRYLCPTQSEWPKDIHCSNEESECVDMAIIGECFKKPYRMAKYCYRSCAQCTGEDLKPVCKDTANDCHLQIREKSCLDNGAWLRTCRMSCGLCKPSNLKEMIRCVDKNDDCRSYAHQCKTDSARMNMYCMRTCNRCDLADCYDLFSWSICQTFKREGECKDPHPFRPLLAETYCKKTCGLCSTQVAQRTAVAPQATPHPSKCVNQLQPDDEDTYKNPDQQCKMYALQGLCTLHEVKMKAECFKTCFCDRVQPTRATESPRIPTQTTIRTTPQTSKCVNRLRPDAQATYQDPDRQCAVYASQGLCDMHRIKMEAECYKTCYCDRTTPHPSKCVNRRQPTRNDVVKDPDKLCKMYAAYDHCKLDAVRMTAECYKSCYCETCFDAAPDCKRRVAEGQCYSRRQTLAKYMMKHCAKSCRACEEDGDTGQVVKVTERPIIYTDRYRTTVREKPRTDGGSYGVTFIDRCCDRDTQECEQLGDVGCQNSYTVRRKCPRTCKVCKSGCEDKKERCRGMAELCNLENHKKAMEYYCPLTCKICQPCAGQISQVTSSLRSYSERNRVTPPAGVNNSNTWFVDNCCDDSPEECKRARTTDCQYSDDIQRKCRRTCKVCLPKCIDKTSSCASLANNCHRESSRQNLLHWCPVTCKFCQPCAGK